MIRKKLAVMAMTIASVIMVLSGCGSSGQDTSEAKIDDVVLNENCIEDIKTKGKLVVGCKTDVPGLSYYDEDTDSFSGIEIELAYKTAADIFEVSSEEAKEQNLVEFIGVTVADREDMLESGEIDCMLATYTITDERAEKFALSNSYYTDYIGLLVKKTVTDSNSLGSKGINSIADLDGKYIGVPRNATTRDTFINYINTMNTIKVNPIFCEYESYEQLFKALKNGNIDVMSVDVSILNGYVDNSTKILNDRFGGQRYGAAVKKENAALLDYINGAIAQ